MQTTSALCLATEGGGVNLYDPVTNRFTRYPYTPDTPDGFIGSTVLNAFKDNHNNIWFGSPPPSGISRINTVTGETAQYSQQEGIDGLVWDGIVDTWGEHCVRTIKRQIGGVNIKKLSTESRALEPAMRDGSDGTHFVKSQFR